MLIEFKSLDISFINDISKLIKQLNPTKEIKEINDLVQEMFSYKNYHCFGLFKNDILIGISGAWITTRVYSGKQLEIDHFVIDENKRSTGLGKLFLDEIENWAKSQNCLHIELNAYVQTEKAHKFYFRNEFKILGFHFQKKVN